METERNEITVMNLTERKDKLMTEVLEERCKELEEQVKELNNRLTHLEKLCAFDRTVVI